MKSSATAPSIPTTTTTTTTSLGLPTKPAAAAPTAVPPKPTGTAPAAPVAQAEEHDRDDVDEFGDDWPGDKKGSKGWHPNPSEEQIRCKMIRHSKKKVLKYCVVELFRFVDFGEFEKKIRFSW